MNKSRRGASLGRRDWLKFAVLILAFQFESPSPTVRGVIGNMRVLLGSGFFESELPSFREYSYSKELALLGHEVTLLCGDQSYVWSGSRAGLPPTNPTLNDREF